MALRPKLNRIWGGATATTRRDPGDAKYNQGWVSEIPTYQVLNYLQWKMDTTMLAIAERGVAEWGTDVTYKKGSLVWDETNATIYVAIVNAPTAGTKPSSNSPHWSASSIQVTRAGYDKAVSNINTHIADRTTNPHGLTADMLNAYNKAQIDALVAQYNALVKAHTDRRDNPHDVTASQIGAVPVTGGTYTGDVTFNTGLYFNTAKTAKLFVDTAGNLALQNGGTTLGVTTAGKAYVSSGVASSNIVLDSDFEALKLANQPAYNAPPEIYKMNLIGDLNVQTGAIDATSNFDPVFSSQYGCLDITNPGAGSSSIFSDSDVLPAGELTVVFDVLAVTQRNPTDDSWILAIGTANRRVMLTGGSKIVVETTGTTGTPVCQMTGPINTWYRIAAVWTASTRQLFLDGVLVGSSNVVNPATVSGKARLEMTAKPAALQRRLLFRNFRLFSQALTAKQISTL